MHPKKGSRATSPHRSTPDSAPRGMDFSRPAPTWERRDDARIFSSPRRESLSLPPSLYLIPVPPPFPLSSAPSDDLLSPVFRLPFVVTDGWHGDVTVDARRDAWCPVFRISRVPAARLTIFRRRQHRNSRWILKRGNILGEKEGGGGGLGSTVIDGVTEWKTCRGSLNVFRDASFSSLFFFYPSSFSREKFLCKLEMRFPLEIFLRWYSMIFFNSSSKRKKTFLFQQLCVPPIHRIEYIILYRDVQIFVSFLLRCSNSPRGSAIEVSGRVHRDN